MFVNSLKLLGFRNYLEADIEFHSPKTIIIGKNAQGKSNLLEVIQILSHIKSRRTTKDAELVNFALEQAVVHATISRQSTATEGLDTIALLIRKSGRRTLKINDSPRKPQELLHNIYSVSFMVDDIEIINGGPAKRRDWLDSVIIQVSLDYKDITSKFDKALSCRNSFFKELAEEGKYYYRDLNKAEVEQLRVWDEMFIDRANELTSARQRYIDELKPIAAKYYQDISGSSIQLDIDYLGKNIDFGDLEECRARDFARSYTNIGPQRDEIKFSLDDNLASHYASQGERRTITLALKLAELELLKAKHGEYPVLLLDDVLAELDEDRQDYLLDSINSDTQVIITTTHLGSHLEKWSDNAQIIEIDAGVIIANSHSREKVGAT